MPPGLISLPLRAATRREAATGPAPRKRPASRSPARRRPFACSRQRLTQASGGAGLTLLQPGTSRRLAMRFSRAARFTRRKAARRHRDRTYRTMAPFPGQLSDRKPMPEATDRPSPYRDDHMVAASSASPCSHGALPGWHASAGRPESRAGRPTTLRRQETRPRTHGCQNDGDAPVRTCRTSAGEQLRAKLGRAVVVGIEQNEYAAVTGHPHSGGRDHPLDPARTRHTAARFPHRPGAWRFATPIWAAIRWRSFGRALTSPSPSTAEAMVCGIQGTLTPADHRRSTSLAPADCPA
jgi:hypothetical protein